MILKSCIYKFCSLRFKIRSLRAYKNRKIIAVDFIKTKKVFQWAESFFFTDNKLFWETVKSFFSDKENCRAIIKLVEKEVLQNDSEIVENLNEFFKNAFPL